MKAEKVILLCVHLYADRDLPCIQVLNYPAVEEDSGESYLCLDCAESPDWHSLPFEVACKHCCKVFSITETVDCRDEEGVL